MEKYSRYRLKASTIRFYEEHEFAFLYFMFFIVAVLFGRYRMASRMGTLIFPVQTFIAFVLYIHTKREIQLSRLEFVYLMFVLYRIIMCVIANENFSGDVKTITYKELGTLLIALPFSRSIEEKNVVKVIRNLALLLNLLGCIEYITNSSLFHQLITVESRRYMISLIGTDQSRVRTIFIHPILCAVFTTMAWTIFLGNRYQSKIINSIYVLSTLGCVIGTGSRSSWVSMIIVTSVYYFPKRIRNRKIDRSWVIRSLLIIVLLATLTYVFRNNINRIIETIVNRTVSGLNLGNISNYNRTKMIQIGFEWWSSTSSSNKIFGGGGGTALNLLQHNPINGWSAAVDNTYLTVLLDYGVIGLLLILTILCSSIYGAFTSKIEQNRILYLALFSLMISGFFYDMFGWFTACIPFILIIAFLHRSNIRLEQKDGGS